MQWFLYGFKQNGQRIVLVQGHTQGEILSQMGSSGIERARSLGCAEWQMKCEWSGHVSSGR